MRMGSPWLPRRGDQHMEPSSSGKMNCFILVWKSSNQGPSMLTWKAQGLPIQNDTRKPGELEVATATRVQEPKDSKDPPLILHQTPKRPYVKSIGIL